MAVEVEIREIEKGDIDLLMADMRQADRDEIAAATSIPLKKAVSDSVALSSYSRAGWVNGRLACLWGVCPISLATSNGAPWFLSTSVIEQHPMLFLRRCRPHVQEFRDRYRFMVNYVDARNRVAIHWLKWLGFDMEEPRPWGIKGLPFHRFTMRTD